MNKLLYIFHMLLLLLCCMSLLSCFEKRKGEINISVNKKNAEIFVNGKRKGIIYDKNISLTLTEGDHKIEIIKHSDDGEWVYKSEKNVYIGAETSSNIDIDLKRFPSTKRQIREDKEKRDRQKFLSELADRNSGEKQRDKDFIAYKNGTVFDVRRNLMWPSESYNSCISWENAKKYCEDYNGGGYSDWRMPSIEELSHLYSEDRKQNCLECEHGKCSMRDNCHITTDLINLSHNKIWTLNTFTSEKGDFFICFICFTYWHHSFKQHYPTDYDYGWCCSVLPVRKVMKAKSFGD